MIMIIIIIIIIIITIIIIIISFIYPSLKIMDNTMDLHN